MARLRKVAIARSAGTDLRGVIGEGGVADVLVGLGLPVLPYGPGELSVGRGVCGSSVCGDRAGAAGRATATGCDIQPCVPHGQS